MNLIEPKNPIVSREELFGIDCDSLPLCGQSDWRGQSEQMSLYMTNS